MIILIFGYGKKNVKHENWIVSKEFIKPVCGNVANLILESSARVSDDPEYQGEFSIPWKRNGERKRIRFRAWSGNDAIYHLNRGRRETTISVPLGVLLLHSRRERRGPGLHYRRPSLKLRLVTASDKPSPQPNKQTVVFGEERASASITPRRRENWNELVSSLALSPR